MTEDEYRPRLFESDAAVRHIGEGLLARALAREEWTHEAHLGACLWLLVERPDIAPERDLPGLIRRFNESVGGVNDETQGYHETITQCFIRGVRGFLARTDPALGLAAKVNGLLLEPEGRRDWPLRFYTGSDCSRSRRGWGWWSRIWRLHPLSLQGEGQGEGVRQPEFILERWTHAAEPNPRAAQTDPKWTARLARRNARPHAGGGRDGRHIRARRHRLATGCEGPDRGGGKG
jgi:hypothetical protein